MKKLIILLIVTATFGQVSAQDAITKFFGKYEDDESFSHVSLNSRMFSLLTDLELDDQEDQELLDAITQLQGLKILAKDDTPEGKALYKEAFLLLPKNEYDELMSIRDEGRDMKFLIKEKAGTINELLMVMGSENEFFILSLVGNIDLNKIAKLSTKMDIDGFDNLEKLKDRDN